MLCGLCVLTVNGLLEAIYSKEASSKAHRNHNWVIETLRWRLNAREIHVVLFDAATRSPDNSSEGITSLTSYAVITIEKELENPNRAPADDTVAVVCRWFNRQQSAMFRNKRANLMLCGSRVRRACVQITSTARGDFQPIGSDELNYAPRLILVINSVVCCLSLVGLLAHLKCQQPSCDPRIAGWSIDSETTRTTSGGRANPWMKWSPNRCSSVYGSCCPTGLAACCVRTDSSTEQPGNPCRRKQVTGDACQMVSYDCRVCFRLQQQQAHEASSLVAVSCWVFVFGQVYDFEKTPKTYDDGKALVRKPRKCLFIRTVKLGRG